MVVGVAAQGEVLVSLVIEAAAAGNRNLLAVVDRNAQRVAVLAARAGLDADQTARRQVNAQVGSLVNLDRVGQVDAGWNVERLAGAVDGGDRPGKTGRSARPCRWRRSEIGRR